MFSLFETWKSAINIDRVGDAPQQTSDKSTEPIAPVLERLRTDDNRWQKNAITVWAATQQRLKVNQTSASVMELTIGWSTTAMMIIARPGTTTAAPI